MECTESFVALLSEFRCVFTAPSFLIFVNLMTGWVLSHRRRFVTELIWSSGSTRRGHHSRYHRFFSQSVWELDTLTWVLAKLLVALFAPSGIIELAVVSGDSAYGGASVLRKLPDNVELISHVHPKGALYEPAPPRQPGQKGAGRKKGRRLPGMAAWAADPRQPWRKLVFDQFGLHATLLVKTIYAARWSIEVTFENSKQLLGLEDPANRKEKAVRRTAPLALVLYGLIIAWFHQEGHRHLRFPDRAWYLTKDEPSFADMLTTLRRQSWQDKFRILPLRSRPVKKWLSQVIEFLCLAG